MLALSPRPHIIAVAVMSLEADRHLEGQQLLGEQLGQLQFRGHFEPLRLQEVVAQRRKLSYGMVRQIVDCYHRGSEKLKKNGFSPDGKQKYLCKECGKASRENPAAKAAKGYSEARKEEILRAYQERSSLRGLARTFGVLEPR